MPPQRPGLLVGPAAAAAMLVDPDSTAVLPADADGRDRLVLGLLAFTRNLVVAAARDGAGGLAIVIDDAHWADPASLRFLAHLAGRAGAAGRADPRRPPRCRLA